MSTMEREDVITVSQPQRFAEPSRLIRHGIDRLRRNRNKWMPSARVFDDPTWLREQYRTQTAIRIATELESCVELCMR